MDNPVFAKLAGICLTIAVLAVAIFVAGAILGVILSLLVPIILLFTAGAIVAFAAKDYSKERSNDKH